MVVKVLVVLLGLGAAWLPAQGQAQDAAQAVVRLQQLEEQVRQLNGQVEQLQFQNRRLDEQLKRLQNDIDFRFRELEGGRGASRPGGQTAPPPAVSQPGTTPAPGGRTGRGDAFDPAAQAGAPGSPRPLGPGNPPATGTSPAPRNVGPVAVPGQIIVGEPNTLGREAGPPLDLDANGQPRNRVPTLTVGEPGQTPRQEIDAGKALLAQGSYEAAETIFRDFMRKRPRDRLLPEAMIGLGDSYFQRQRWREAAEQYVDFSAKYPSVSRAPEAQLKLGVSLRNLGAVQEACAVLAEVSRKYPSASAAIKQGVTREQQRARCT